MESKGNGRGGRETQTDEGDFPGVLRALLHRPTHRVTPGWLSKMSGIPKATIVNWLEGRVRRPRSAAALHAVCDALRLAPQEAAALYASVGLDPDTPVVAPRFDHVPVGLYVTTVDGRILTANATLVAMLGYRTFEEYRARSARDLYADPAERERWIAKIDRCETLRREPVRARRADGSVVSLLDSATAIRDRHGRIRYFEGVWETDADGSGH